MACARSKTNAMKMLRLALVLLLVASQCFAFAEKEEVEDTPSLNDDIDEACPINQQAALQRIYCNVSASGGRWCLWLGNYLSVTEQALQARNITAVLSIVDYTAYTGFELLRAANGGRSLTALLPYEAQQLQLNSDGSSFHCDWLGACAEFTAKTMWLPAVDAARFKFKQALELSLGFIEKTRADGDNVLVHCVEGKSRSASVVIAFIMDELGLSFNQALEFVRRRRPVVNPNQGFRRLLLSRSASNKSSNDDEDDETIEEEEEEEPKARNEEEQQQQQKQEEQREEEEEEEEGIEQ